MKKRYGWAIPALFLLLAAGCGQTPDQTNKARGVLSGVNLVLGMTVVLIVLTVVFLVGVLASDRFVRTRRRLATAPAAEPVEEEDTDEVVAGITMGRAGVPKWLYGAYVLIPLFAFGYVFSNVHVPKPHAKRKTSLAAQG